MLNYETRAVISYLKDAHKDRVSKLAAHYSNAEDFRTELMLLWSDLVGDVCDGIAPELTRLMILDVGNVRHVDWTEVATALKG